MPRILADSDIPFLSDMLPEEVNYIPFEGAYPRPDDLEQADALIVRTITKIDETLLDVGRKLKFLGTATAGFDHVDYELLSQRGISFAYAPGCNARSVAEYVMTVLLLWAEEQGEVLPELKLGLVGCGYAGSEVKKLAEKAGMRVLCYDPPKTHRDPNFVSVAQEDILQCDILSFHCSLDTYPDYPNWHWLQSERLSRCTSRLLINAARGGIIDEQALLSHAENNHVKIVTDVWENEPGFSRRLMAKSRIATPHIAGYSIQAKWKGSRMIADQLIAHFGLSPTYVPAPAVGYTSELSGNNFRDILLQIHPLMEYDHRLRQLAGGTTQERKNGFLKLRAGFPLRHEYPYMRIDEEIVERFPQLALFSFRKDHE